MSHEIRTPLNALSGFSSLLTEEGLDNETRRQCNDVILQNSELLLKLINDVIDLSSLEFGKIQFSIAKHDVVGICRNVTDTVSKVKQTQAEIHFITEQESMEIETDDSRLQQVLINLLINATKFTPQGSIILEVKKGSKEELLFSVTDTGCGIPKEKQATIFQRFEKLNEMHKEADWGFPSANLSLNISGVNMDRSQLHKRIKILFHPPYPTATYRQRQKGKQDMKQLLIILTLLALPLSVQSISTDRKSPPSLSHKQLVEIEHGIIYGIRQADSLVNAGKPDEALSFYKKSLKAKDSLYNLLTTSQMEEILASYNIDKLILQKSRDAACSIISA